MPPAPPSSLESADSLYQGFPDFSTWGPLRPEDADLWSRFSASLAERREAATPEALKASVDVAIRAAALDTGAIEGLYTVDRGFTMTVAVQGMAWEQMIEERGAGVRDLFEAQLQAYELVLDAVTHKLPVTEAWIRALHETLCAPQKTYRVLTASGWQEHELPRGQYKTQPNHVRLKDGSFHAYAPVERVPTEMHRLIEQLRSPEFEAAHPILQASWVHYAFVAIHPFADGNGRVARALASVYFYRTGSIPLLVFANQKLAYLDVLHEADLGNLRSLIGFFRDRGIDTMQFVAEGLLTAGLPSVEALAERIRGRQSPELSPRNLEDLRVNLEWDLYRRFEALADKLGIVSNVLLDHSGDGIALRILKSSAEAHMAVWVSRESEPFAFRVWSGKYEDDLDIRVQDVHPELSEALKLRLDAWVQRQLSRMLAEIEENSRLPP
jgi:Fic family protein